MRFRVCKVCGELFETENPCHEQESDRKHAAYVWGDIEPYKSMITGEVIGSRKRHREHLRENGCIEAGNEQKYFMNTEKAREDAARQQETDPRISRHIDKLVQER